MALSSVLVGVTACVTACVMTGTTLVAQSSDVAFGRDILPILSHNCFACHGPDEHARKAHLELHRRAVVLAKKVLVPGDSAASEIIRRLLATDDDHMPPKKTGKTLTTGEIDLIRRWIDQGAKWGVHWSFEKVVRPPLPAVKSTSWPKSDLDRFVLAKIEARGLAPSPQADRPTLIRRLSLDLTGLPPTPAEVAAFARDERPDAYAKLVDSLLQRPTYGEHWTRLWLDLARYADTKGYEKDRVRTIWPYRDWLIRSFNADLPFDEFTRDQLAGDLVAKPTEDQLIATAFHRNTLANDEGGTDDEEFRVAAVKDRVDTTIQIWMGLSMGCAKCHSHKYDPISQREYYEFFAIFNQTQDADRADDAPTLPLPTAEQRKLLRQIDADLAAQRRVLNAETPELARAQAAWETAERNKAAGNKAAGNKAAGNKANGASKLPKGILEILKLTPKKRTDAQRGKLAQHFRHVTPLLAATRKAIRKLEAQKRKNRPVRLPIMRELDAARHRKTHIHVRGSFLTKGNEVQPGVPAAFGTLPKGAPKNRLGVAQWLTDRGNPLTARVTVNRWWAQFFGIGIVATQEDFGSQGATPSHPRLLDWLATEFVRQGYSMKRLCKTIVMSATYRQRSSVTKELLAMDRFNRLLARGPSCRMSAETIRDNALAISGLLSHKLYGPSVMPPQPAGIWQSTYNSTKWQTSPGEDRWRRGIYTFVKRTSGYPSTLLFDAPTRETCTLRRIPTNTPLQALVTLNDPVFVEAAQALARRLVREGGASVEDRLRYGLRLAVARAPRATEVSRLRRLYEHRLTYYRVHAERARRMATEPLGPADDTANLAELAAWTVVCNVILNLDEVLVKR